MAELSAFGYRHRSTPLHALDARIKLAGLMAVSTATLAAGPFGLLPASALAAIGFRQSGIPLRRALREMRYFLVLLVGVWIVRGWTTPGEPLVAWGAAAISRQGILEGAMLCWRWLLIVCLGLSMCAATRSSDIRAAVEWFLRPLPGAAAHKVGTMIGLLMRFIPVILAQAAATAEAQRARAVENRKNPVYRLGRLGMPLVRRTFLMADRLAMAMEARCYGDQRTPHARRLRRSDKIALLLVVAVCSGMILA